MARSGDTQNIAPADSSPSSSRPEPPDPLIGTTLNNAYVVESLLGEGGMGRVYAARHTRVTGKRFAVKVLRAEMAGDPDVLARFHREAEAAARISHPNVIGVYDVDVTKDGLPYLVCEHLEGMELADYVASAGKITTGTAIQVAYNICEALEAAHEVGVIHRDLKPQNIFLVGNFDRGVPRHPVIKVLDFGLSRFEDSTNTLTRTGMIMGTPSYMAPEQARGDKTDHRTDIYGVGAILYTLLTGRPPFDKSSPRLTLLAVTSEDPPRPRSIDPAIPEHLELAVQRAMAKDPADRFPDVASLKHAVDPYADSIRVAVPRRPMLSRAAIDAETDDVRTARPRLLFMIALAVILLAVVLSMAVVAFGRLTGWLTFQPVELALLLLGALGTALTPGIILITRLRREVWQNTARVMDTLESTSAPLIAGLVGYGTAAMLVRFTDIVIARFAKTPLIGHADGPAWLGWDLIFPAVGALSAAAVWLRRRPAVPAGSLPRRMGRPAVYATVATASVAIALVGLHWRARNATAMSVPEPAAIATASASSAPIPQPLPSAQPDAAASSAASSEEPVVMGSAASRLADPSMLASASAKGIEALVALSSQYPEDPDVLQALMFAHASRAAGHRDSMSIAQTLFATDPERAKNRDVQLLVSTMARTSTTASERALGVMGEHMGTHGPDMLYDMMISTDEIAGKARRELARPEVRKRFSPALRIAYELRTAQSCAARLPLLERAVRDGDQRVVVVLASLSTGTTRGCGPRKSKACPAPCPSESEAFNSAIHAVAKRLSPGK